MNTAHLSLATGQTKVSIISTIFESFVTNFGYFILSLQP